MMLHTFLQSISRRLLLPSSVFLFIQIWKGKAADAFIEESAAKSEEVTAETEVALTEENEESEKSAQESKEPETELTSEPVKSAIKSSKKAKKDKSKSSKKKKRKTLRTDEVSS